MISFKDYFLITESRQEMYGWMAPNGRMFPNTGDDIHSDNAETLIQNFNIPKRGFHVYERMYYAGWMRVGYEANIIYVTNNQTPPNPNQMRFLKNLAERFHMKEIVFDNETNDRVLWSSEDF